MLLFQEHHSPTRLAVERCGRVEDGVTDDVLDSRIGDFDVVLERVQRTSILEGIADGEFGGRHGEPRAGWISFRGIAFIKTGELVNEVEWGALRIAHESRRRSEVEREEDGPKANTHVKNVD